MPFLVDYGTHSTYLSLHSYTHVHSYTHIHASTLHTRAPIHIHNTHTYTHTAHTQSGIVGALKLGSFVGAFVGGALMLRYGRRKAIALCSIFGVLGPLLMAGASGVG